MACVYVLLLLILPGTTDLDFAVRPQNNALKRPTGNSKHCKNSIRQYLILQLAYESRRPSLRGLQRASTFVSGKFVYSCENSNGTREDLLSVCV